MLEHLLRQIKSKGNVIHFHRVGFVISPGLSGQKNPFTRYNMANDRNKKFAKYKKRKQNQS